MGKKNNISNDWKYGFNENTQGTMSGKKEKKN